MKPEQNDAGSLESTSSTRSKNMIRQNAECSFSIKDGQNNSQHQDEKTIEKAKPDQFSMKPLAGFPKSKFTAFR